MLIGNERIFNVEGANIESAGKVVHRFSAKYDAT